MRARDWEVWRAGWHTADDAGGGGGGNVSDADDGDTFQLKGDNEVRTVTKAQLLGLAQKGAFVLPKLQSTLDSLRAEMEKMQDDYKLKTQFIEDVRAIVRGDERAREAVERIGSIVGFTDDDVEDILGGSDERSRRAPRPPRGRSDDEDDDVDLDLEEELEEIEQYSRRPLRDPLVDGGRDGRRGPIRISDLDKDLQQLLRQVQQRSIAELRESMFQDLMRELDSDKELASILDEKSAGVVRRIAQEKLRLRAGLDGDDYGPRLLKEIVDDVKTTLKALGIQNSSDKPKDLRALGIGRAANTDELQAMLASGKPPPRVPVDAPDYKDYMWKRLVHRIGEAGGIADEGEEPETIEDELESGR